MNVYAYVCVVYVRKDIRVYIYDINRYISVWNNEDLYTRVNSWAM